MESVFSDVIRRARERRGWSKAELGARMNPPRGRTALANAEGGLRFASETLLRDVAAACGITLEELLVEELEDAGMVVRVEDLASVVDGWRRAAEESFFAGVIRGARQRKGWSQGYLAQRCGSVKAGSPRLGAHVGGWESGRHPIKERTLGLVAKALGMSLLELIASELIARGYAKPVVKPPKSAGRPV